MTAYRIDEFEGDDDDFDLEPIEGREQISDEQPQNDAVLVTEVIEPKVYKDWSNQ